MKKSQVEIVITSLLFVLLVYFAWNNFLRDGEEPPEAPEVLEKETVAETPAPDIVPEERVPVSASRRRLQFERIQRDWGVDPFSRAPEPSPEKPPEEEILPEDEYPDFVLKGIVSLNESKMALVGTDIVSVGDTVGGYEVVEISGAAIIVRKEEREHEIRIHD